MRDSREPVLQRMIRGCSRLPLVEWLQCAVCTQMRVPLSHSSMFTSFGKVRAAIGILGGILVMFLGAGIAYASKSSQTRSNT